MGLRSPCAFGSPGEHETRRYRFVPGSDRRPLLGMVVRPILGAFELVPEPSDDGACSSLAAVGSMLHVLAKCLQT
jgi:hypothetical protein